MVPDLDEPPPDDPPDVSVLFDPDETLPYMLGDDPELLEDDNQFDHFSQVDSQVPSNITCKASGVLDPQLDPGDQFEPSIRPRTLRSGHNINTRAVSKIRSF